jgi:hypothetical protein
MVRIKIKIQDHEEILELAVSNIGKKDVFIGHDWLMHHNPEMDWKNNQIRFSRCPGECYEESKVNEPEDKIDQFDSTTDKIPIAAILSQLDDNGKWRPVAFLSRSLNDAERNYEIYDKEMLAIMHGFYEWAHYLKGNDEITEVLTDHQNLTFFRKPQNLNRRQARWIMDLQEYNFTIKHRPGKANTKADILSRRAGFPKGENNNEDVILLKENHFRNIEIRLNEESREWLDLRSEIKKIHRRYYDKQVERGIKQRDPNFKKDEFNDYWMWKECIYVPINQTLRERAIRWCHDEPMAGHPGIAKTLELTTRTFWWPNMKKDIEKYIKACHECQISKPD